MQRLKTILLSPSVLVKHCILLSLLVTLHACSEEPDAPPIRVVSNAWAGYEPIFMAESEGIYKKDAVHIIETPLSLLPIQALRGETIDAAGMSLSRALISKNSNLDLTIVMIMDASNGADALLARPGLTSIADLRGKRVAAEMKTVNGYLLMRALQKAELSTTDITLINTNNQAIPALYANREIDAAAVFGVAHRQMSAQGAEPVFTSADIPAEILDVLVVRTAFLKEYPERVQQFIDGVTEVMHYLATRDKADPLPQGAMEHDVYLNTLQTLNTYDIEDNLALFDNGGQALNDILKKRLEIGIATGVLPEGSAAPGCDSSFFLKAIEKIEGRES